MDVKNHLGDKETPQANTQDLLGTFLSTCIPGISQDHVTGGNWRLPGTEELGVALVQGGEPPAVWKDPEGRAPGHHGHLHVQALPGNILFELSPLLPGLPAMLFAIFSSSVRKEMAA